MTTLDFAGRVAVVTGAGRGIGRAYALLLGQRGASVVVNDLGGSTRGTGHDPAPAQEVADEIIMRGTFNITRAAWPHMEARNYGRVVLTGSTGMFGMYDNLSYATAKAGMIGLAQALTVNAGDHDIKINVIAPNAWTRMAGDPSKGMDELRAERPAGAPPHLEPELVAPMVAFLAHESCPVSAGIYTAGGGRFARLFVGATDGYLVPGVTDQGAVPTPEDVAANWAAINDEAGYYVPASTLGWSARYMSHLYGKET
jgi:NAD(P)-dependent dehydrogenase (short-subunit alcohol dehydrogenase family)